MSEWQTIETAPKDTWVLVVEFDDFDRTPSLHVACRTWTGWGARAVDSGMAVNPTHWMPLPLPPPPETTT